jgi:hypothetical protein
MLRGNATEPRSRRPERSNSPLGVLGGQPDGCKQGQHRPFSLESGGSRSYNGYLTFDKWEIMQLLYQGSSPECSVRAIVSSDGPPCGKMDQP